MTTKQQNRRGKKKGEKRLAKERIREKKKKRKQKEEKGKEGEKERSVMFIQTFAIQEVHEYRTLSATLRISHIDMCLASILKEISRKF